MTRPDYFEMTTETLNSHLRTIVDAIRTKVQENPGAPTDLKRVTERLNQVAAEFTETFYEDPPREDV